MLRKIQFIETVLKIIFRHPITGVTVLPIMPNGKIVLVQRRDNHQWGLPGGIINWGEDITTAAKRELKEETGLELVKICRLVGVYSSPHRDPRIHSISILVESTVQGNFEIEDTGEILAVTAFSPEEIPRGNLCHDHDQQLSDYFQGKTTIA